jgi:Rrf2 family protein
LDFVRIGEGVEWAVHCATVLAALPPAATLPGKALAELHGVSETYLLKHLQSLTGAGLLESVPGPRGGYRLGRPADQISLLDVVQAVEGSETAFRCTDIRARGPAQPPDQPRFARTCAINQAMLRAEVAWRESLRATSVADLAAQAQAGMGKRRLKLAAAWLGDNVRLTP